MIRCGAAFGRDRGHVDLQSPFRGRFVQIDSNWIYRCLGFLQVASTTSGMAQCGCIDARSEAQGSFVGGSHGRGPGSSGVCTVNSVQPGGARGREAWIIFPTLTRHHSVRRNPHCPLFQCFHYRASPLDFNRFSALPQSRRLTNCTRRQLPRPQWSQKVR
ncbi:hypothetical protein VUR80DRAFT_557 [Thermomyces stellatus]